MFKITVRPEVGDSYTVTGTTRDVLMWEKTTKGRTLGMLEKDASLVDMYKIAWFAATRTGKFAGTQAEFEASCDIDVDTDGDPDPTPPGH